MAMPHVVFRCFICNKRFIDEQKLKKHTYYESNKEHFLMKTKEWVLRNKEKRREIVNKYNRKESTKINKRKWHEKKYFDGNITLLENRECFLCRKKDDLVIHHVNGLNGQNGRSLDNSPSNLVVICRSCHPKVHNSHWIREEVFRV